MAFFVYMLQCADGSYYVGSHRGVDVLDRVEAHNLGLDRKAYTYPRRPVECVWSEAFGSPEDMVLIERRLKGWSRAKKEALIAGDIPKLKALAMSHSAPPDPKKSKFYTLTGQERPKS